MGVQPNEVVHIGDSWEFDVKAPQSAGLKAFHLNREQKSNAFASLSALTELNTKLFEA
jgi:FMN phosphatase YigB (HAD superfamily)